MRVSERKAYTAEEYADQVKILGRGTFQSKELRDEVANILNREERDTGRNTISGQQLHPEYVTDYVGILETGFGNSQYDTYWGKLYQVTVVR